MSAPPVTIHVCATCRRAEDAPDGSRGGARLAAALTEANAAAGHPFTVVAVECLSVCKRPITVAFSGPERWTYVYGDFPPEAAEAILSAAGQFAAAPEGLIPWRERPEALKRGVIARLPPAPSSSKAAAE